MSLLEDIFLQDEANEAEELERVIEGDEFEERRRSDSDDNDEKEDEAEEDKRRVDPTKAKTTRVVKNPRFLLNPARLTGPRGIQVIPNHFKDFKFKGKGYEKEDLDIVLKRLEHWAYRLYPKFQFEDCLKKIEMLGKKRPVAVHLHKIRSDQFLSEDTVVQKESSDEDTPMPEQEEDEFDKLLQQQIELARSTPAPNSAKKPAYDGSVSPKDKRTSYLMPKAASSPSINDEQRDRMMRSRRLAEERRIARLKAATNTESTDNDSSLIKDNEYPKGNEDNSELSREQGANNETVISRKHNRSNVIDSSDEETILDTSVSVAVDVHNTNKVVDKNKIVENDKSVHNNNGNSHSDEEEAENEIDIDEGRELIVDNEDKIQESNMSRINREQQNGNLINDSLNEKSVENDELRYDDSDTNIDLNEPNISNKDNEDKISSESVSELSERNKLSNNKDHIDEEVISSTEGSSNVELDKSPSAHIDSIQAVGNKQINKANIVSDEIIDDVMDVDFTDDF